ncbi:GIY-YIG nuclease family protein [Agromyces bracchium]|uniref:GIY-YIG nuclease family protein n=1 Tax=Agromyces bracchium TaxID=88376 RepID=A0A6I3M8W4_9MICO|nr:GIY-YIG nuclease family protein [Agromyces bracchium]MTH69421.1 GIY-YIG nuclease family protein [Agromyces bracchium]
MVTDAAACTAVDEFGPCGAHAEPGAPLALCTPHLLAAHDWVAREHGVTDVLPGACLLCGSRVGVRYPSGWVCAVCEWRVGEVPDGELAPPRVDVVYYVRWRERVKIGTSSNPRQRLAAIPHDEVLAFERGGRALEQRRHAGFAASRWPGGEWFRFDKPIVRHVAELAADGEDPWSRYDRWRSEELARRM